MLFIVSLNKISTAFYISSGTWVWGIFLAFFGSGSCLQKSNEKCLFAAPESIKNVRHTNVRIIELLSPSKDKNH